MKSEYGKTDGLFKKACALEESLSYSYGPPVIIKPIHEAYVEWLLKQNRNEEALEIFNNALVRQPRRLLSLRGKLEAAKRLDSEVDISQMEKEIALSTESKERDVIL